MVSDEECGCCCGCVVLMGCVRWNTRIVLAVHISTTFGSIRGFVAVLNVLFARSESLQGSPFKLAVGSLKCFHLLSIYIQPMLQKQKS